MCPTTELVTALVDKPDETAMIGCLQVSFYATQVSQYVDSKAADVGFSAKSIVVAPEIAGKGKWVEVPTESYEPIAQGVVILKHGSEVNGDAARKFYGFVLSDKAREIFSRTGYLSAPVRSVPDTPAMHQ